MWFFSFATSLKPFKKILLADFIFFFLISKFDSVLLKCLASPTKASILGFLSLAYLKSFQQINKQSVKGMQTYI